MPQTLGAIDMWVFAYGSLLWNAGFTPQEKSCAILAGYSRSFCMWSVHYRGTKETPGLVLALDRANAQAACRGMALRVAEHEKDMVLDMLRKRELISSAYYEDWLEISLEDGRKVQAVTYVINRDHDQYCKLDSEEQAQIIAKATGKMGPNADYLFNTTDMLQQAQIPDGELDWLSCRVRDLYAAT